MENIMPAASTAASTAAMKEKIKAQFAGWWGALMEAVDGGADGFGLFGASSYVLRVGSAKLLIDPCLRSRALLPLIADRAGADLPKFDAVLLTHSHVDHLCPRFWELAADVPLKKVYVPDFFDDALLTENGIDPARVTRVSAGDVLTIGDATVTAFASNHKRESQTVGLPELGYRFQAGGKTYLMPCDVRTYDPAFYRDLLGSAPDMLFGHVWLLAKHGLAAPWEPKLTEFCDFLAAFAPKRVSLAHLYETGRTPDEIWTYVHAGAIEDRLLSVLPDADVLVPRLGRWYAL